MITLLYSVFLVVGCLFHYFGYILPLLACKVSARKSADSIMGVPLYVTSCFSLAVFKSLYLYESWFGALCASWTWISLSFPRFGKFSDIVVVVQVLSHV